MPNNSQAADQLASTAGEVVKDVTSVAVPVAIVAFVLIGLAKMTEGIRGR